MPLISFGNGSGAANFAQSFVNNHYPKPSTPRGKRRHEARNEGQKQEAEKSWGTVRKPKRGKK